MRKGVFILISVFLSFAFLGNVVAIEQCPYEECGFTESLRNNSFLEYDGSYTCFYGYMDCFYNPDLPGEECFPAVLDVCFSSGGFGTVWTYYDDNDFDDIISCVGCDEEGFNCDGIYPRPYSTEPGVEWGYINCSVHDSGCVLHDGWKCSYEEKEVVCGNSEIEEGEECDDGNLEDGDGCSSECLLEFECGDGIWDELLGEVCDDSAFPLDTGCGVGFICNDDCSSCRTPLVECEDQDGDGYDNCEIGEEGDDGKELDCADDYALANPGITSEDRILTDSFGDEVNLCSDEEDNDCDGNADSLDEDCGLICNNNGIVEEGEECDGEDYCTLDCRVNCEYFDESGKTTDISLGKEEGLSEKEFSELRSKIGKINEEQKKIIEKGSKCETDFSGICSANAVGLNVNLNQDVEKKDLCEAAGESVSSSVVPPEVNFNCKSLGLDIKGCKSYALNALSEKYKSESENFRNFDLKGKRCDKEFCNVNLDFDGARANFRSTFLQDGGESVLESLRLISADVKMSCENKVTQSTYDINPEVTYSELNCGRINGE
jgi:cysteine-rich repeat protein